MTRKHIYGEDSVRFVVIYATNRDGIPEVEIVGDHKSLETLSPDEADRIADGLKRAAHAAREMRTALDEFLAKGRELK